MWQGHGGGGGFFFSFLFCKVPLPFSPHSFSFKACTEAGLGLWFDLGMVVG